MTNAPYDWEDDAKGSWAQAIAAAREKWLMDNIPGVQRARVIGRCELLQGDCLEILPGLPDDSIRMIWTDPPYGHNNADGDLLAAVNSGKLMGPALAEGRGAKPIANDGMDDMKRVVEGMLLESTRLVPKKGAVCVCCGGGGPRPTFAWLANRMNEEGLEFFHSVIWDKRGPGLGWRYRRQHEMIMVAIRKGGSLSWADTAQPLGNVLHGFLPGHIRKHPNEKPLWLVRGFVERHTVETDSILDPFMGGGTTLVAAAQLGRRGIGIELDAEYFDIAVDRVEQAYREPDLFADHSLPPEPPGEQIAFALESDPEPEAETADD